MRKVCIVPLSKGELPLLALNEDCCLSVAGPKGICFQGEDIGVLWNRKETGLVFSNDMGRSICNSDELIIPYIDPHNNSLYDYAFSALRFGVEKKKIIHCFLPIDRELVSGLGTSTNECLVLYPSSVEAQTYEYKGDASLQRCKAPVIFISDMFPGCGAYEVFLSVSIGLRKRGKMVLAISDDLYNPLFGYERVNWEIKASTKDIVYATNCMICDMEKRMMPDVIVIKLPMPLLPFDEKTNFDFGVSSKIITAAVPGDECIVCSPSGFYEESFWSEYNRSVFSKYGLSISAIHSSNAMLDPALTREWNLVYLPEEMSEESLYRYNRSAKHFHMYNMLDPNSMSSVLSSIYSRLFDLEMGVI